MHIRHLFRVVFISILFAIIPGTAFGASPIGVPFRATPLVYMAGGMALATQGMPIMYSDVWVTNNLKIWKRLVNDDAQSPIVPGRTLSAGYTVGKDIFIAGGREGIMPGQETNEILKSSTGRVWASTTTPSPFSGKSQVVDHAGAYYLFNGESGNSGTALWTSSDGEQWAPVGPLPWLPFPLYNTHQYQVVSFKGSLVAFVSYPPIASVPPVLDIWSSQDNGVSWTKIVSDAPMGGRQLFGLTTHQGKIIFGGGSLYINGSTGNGTHYMNDVWISSTGTDWTQVVTYAPWEGRLGHTFISAGRKLVLFGGHSLPIGASYVVDYNDVWSSFDGITWTLETASAPWSPRAMVVPIVQFQSI